MAELHRVEINEKVQSEVEPDDAAEAVGTISEEPAREEQQVERPEWLPEKFKSPEDMANAYSELEKKMGQGTNEEQPTETTEDNEGDVQDDKPDDNENADYNAAVVDASKEFFENDGQLSEETYEKLAKAGLPKELVDNYADGMAALAEKQQEELNSLTQGNYESMVEWANENLEQEELNSIQDTITGSDMSVAKLAVQGLYARYQNEVGAKPKLTQGAVTGGSTMPFKSMQELARAQSDPRYKTGDKAYHEEIDRRLSVSRL
jgi:hypothetical protein